MGAIVVVLLVVGIVVFVLLPQEAEYRTAEVARSNVMQEVIFTGRLQAKQQVSLSFELSGQVEEILVKTGDQVSVGQGLVKLDPTTVALELDKAQADLFAASEQAEIAWQTVKNTQEKTEDENEALRLKRRQAVIDAKAELDAAAEYWEKTREEYDEDSSTAKSAELTYQTKLSTYNAAQKQLSETLITIDKSNQAQEDAAELARAKYLATQQAASSIAGPSSLGALTALANLRVEKSELKSPMAGVVTDVALEKGEFATAGAVVVTVATVDDLELEAEVPESDALKLALGQHADITFDALAASDHWQAEVLEIAPAAKIIEGVPTYLVTLGISGPAERLKPGLTANVIVVAGERSDVVVVPRRSLVTQGSRQFVQLLEDGEVVERDVETGLIGSDGLAEILSGLEGGEQLILNGSD